MIFDSSFFRFLIVGFINTFGGYLIYLILVNYFFSHIFSYIVSYILGIVVSYFLTSLFVFRVKPKFSTFSIFPGIYVVQFILGLVGIYVFVDIFGINKNIAPLIIIAFTVPIGFLLSRKVFKKGIK